MIDILLSTYNGEKYLKAQLDSLLAQTYSDWVLFIRDDASTDNTVAIINEYCARFPQKIIQFVDNLGNIGVVRSFEELLKLSKAGYFMFCDQDDVWLPLKIERAMSEMILCEGENPNTPIIICADLQIVNENLESLSNSYWSYSKIVPGLLQKPEQLAVNNYVTGCTMLFNKKTKEVSLPFGRNAIVHDAWIALKVKVSGGIILTLKDSDILYRQHSNNQIGAGNIKYNFNYFSKKIINIKKVIKSNFLIFKQSNEILNISLIGFFYNRIKYLIKR